MTLNISGQIEKEIRFKESCRIIRENTKARNFIEIGGTDASFKNFVPHDSWLIIDKYGDPDVVVDLDGRNAKLPFADNTLEFVICTEVLEHLRMGTPLLKEIYRCLRSNGELFVSVPNVVSLRSRLKWLFGRVPFMAASGDCGQPLLGTGVLVDGYWEGGHVVDFNKKRLHAYLSRTNFIIEKWYSIDVNTGLGFKIPGRIMPVSLNDYLIVKAKKL